MILPWRFGPLMILPWRFGPLMILPWRFGPAMILQHECFPSLSTEFFSLFKKIKDRQTLGNPPNDMSSPICGSFSSCVWSPFHFEDRTVCTDCVQQKGRAHCMGRVL